MKYQDLPVPSLFISFVSPRCGQPPEISQEPQDLNTTRHWSLPCWDQSHQPLEPNQAKPLHRGNTILGWRKNWLWPIEHSENRPCYWGDRMSQGWHLSLHTQPHHRSAKRKILLPCSGKFPAESWDNLSLLPGLILTLPDSSPLLQSPAESH